MAEDSNSSNVQHTFFSNVESLAKAISYASGLLTICVYLFTLGFLESLRIPGYPGVFTSIAFFAGSVFEQLRNGLSYWVVAMCFVSGMILEFGASRIGVIEFLARVLKNPFSLQKVQDDIQQLMDRLKRVEEYSGSDFKILSEIAQIKRDINDLEKSKDEMMRSNKGAYENYLAMVFYLLITLVPLAGYICFIAPALLAVFVPAALVWLISGTLYLLFDFPTRYGRIHQLGILGGSVLLILFGLIPYAAGRSMVLAPNSSLHDRFPLAYDSEPNGRYMRLVWVDDDTRYWIDCDAQDPRLIGKKNETIFFSRYIDDSLRLSACVGD